MHKIKAPYIKVDHVGKKNQFVFVPPVYRLFCKIFYIHGGKVLWV